MRLLLITVIILFQFLPEESSLVHGLPQGSSTDPCETSPCGKGAECKAMGSIAICVCPNDGQGDPFVNCMQQGSDENANSNNGPDNNPQPSPSSSMGPPSPSSPLDSNQFVASFDVGSIHQPQAKPIQISSTAKTTPPKPSTTTTTPPSTTRTTTPYPSKIITGSSTTRTTTTKNPYVHVFETSTFRPPSVDHGQSSQHQGDSYDLYEHSRNRDHNRNNPESHRIPIVQDNSSNNNYPQHYYPPRPISGSGSSIDSSSTTSPSYSTYHGSHVGAGVGTTYDIFNEKTVGPIADYGVGVTSSYPYRGSSSSPGHYSGSHYAYEYDSRPIVPRPTPTSSYHMDRFGHHSYHPTTSGFPDPITESSNPRYSSGHSSSGSSYDIYNFNSRNDISSHSHDYAFTRVNDPLGKYDNCRMVAGLVVCADNSNRYPPHHRENDYPRHGSSPTYNFPLRGDETTMHYGFHSDRNRDRYSSYYPSRYGSQSTSSIRPMFDYNYHGPRHPIDSNHHSFLPKEQRVSAQSVLTISSSASTSTTTARNDNDHPLCKSMCGFNSVCRIHLERPVCGCPEGHSGDPSVRCSPANENMVNGGRGARKDGECERHVDCKSNEICAKTKCIDPCKDPEGFSSSSVSIGGTANGGGTGGSSICGANANCIVIMNTPVCKCNAGHFGNPYVACAP